MTLYDWIDNLTVLHSHSVNIDISFQFSFLTSLFAIFTWALSLSCDMKYRNINFKTLFNLQFSQSYHISEHLQIGCRSTVDFTLMQMLNSYIYIFLKIYFHIPLSIARNPEKNMILECGDEQYHVH